MVTKEDVIEVLKTVVDPEVGISVIDLGLVYDVNVVDERKVFVNMTLTTPGCPMAQVIAKDAERALSTIEGVKVAQVNLVWDPPWTPDMMTDDAKKMLGWM